MPPNALLCMTGSELTRGETRDLNGPFLAAELGAIGVRVDEIVLAPDDPELLAALFDRLVREGDVVILSGGMGPTMDDHTVAVLARVFHRGVLRDPDVLSRMRARARARGIGEDRLPANYWKQAEVIQGAEVLPNPVGLAPGMIIPTERGLVVVLPGVPREMQAILRESVLPALLRRFDMVPPRMLRTKILGVPESMAEARIEKLGIDFGRIEYGISAKPGELLVKFISHRPETHADLPTILELLEGEFGADLVIVDDGAVQAVDIQASVDQSLIVHRALLGARVTLAVAESCTGGLIAKQLTDHAGSSAYFLGGVVAYDNRAKETLLGVAAETIIAHGAVSGEVCDAMARGARARFGSDLALATTGIAGPTGGTRDKPVGLVYVGMAGPQEESILVERQLFWGDRENVRTLAAVRALDLVRRELGVRRLPRE